MSLGFNYDPTWEQDIVWLDPNAKRFPYLREETNEAARRAALPVRWRERYVACAILKLTAPSISRGICERRVWYVMDRDLDGSGSPIQAVDPDSIVAGQRSRKGRRRGEKETIDFGEGASSEITRIPERKV